MPIIDNEHEYTNIVGDILDSSEFTKIDNIVHHGTSRMLHSIKVSYYSYKIAKAMHLNYTDAARGGLLHDFYTTGDGDLVDRAISTFVHPTKASKNAGNVFGVNENEKNIIEGHMFPINFRVPKSSEAWIVNAVDKYIGAKEIYDKFHVKISYAVNLYLLFLLNAGMRIMN